MMKSNRERLFCIIKHKNDIDGGSRMEDMRIWPSIVRQEMGEVHSKEPHLVISYDEPFIYLTGIHASFDEGGVRGTIEIFLGDKNEDEKMLMKEAILYTHTFVGEANRSEKMGGSFESTFPYLVFSNHEAENINKVIKVRLKVDFEGSKCKKTNAKLAVMTSILPLT
jgi:hypothetical protein